jgi:hypothetical protein
MADREPVRWITVKGTHIPIYLDENGKEVFGVGKKAGIVSQGQLDYESKIRSGDKESHGYFDANGNMLMEIQGDSQKVGLGNYEDDYDNYAKFNHEIEQRVWNDVEVHDVHNHPEDTIFSPEDVEAFEALENKSMSIVLKNGTNYRLIREQPRSSNEYVLDMKTGELKQTFEPKKIAPAYFEEYSRIFDKGWKNIKKTYPLAFKLFSRDPDASRQYQERKKAEIALDKKVAVAMEKWLKENASKYGYKFVKE